MPPPKPITPEELFECQTWVNHDLSDADMEAIFGSEFLNEYGFVWKHDLARMSDDGCPHH